MKALWLVVGLSTPLGAELPEGEGKADVEAVCLSCHSSRQIERSLGYDMAGWDRLTAAMVDLSADPELKTRLLAYLVSHFPADHGRTAVQVDGPMQLAWQEWNVPTRGQRARDPIVAPDGTIWWVGQGLNLIGRIKPDGTMQEYALPKGAYPHSVTLDPNGGVWYTGNKNGTIGKIDPNTGSVRQYPMPDPDVRDPHTAIFDAEGIMWFTAQHANRVGRLDPDTGKVVLMTPPRAGSRPYGIKIAADGTPWVACNGNNCLLKVDRASMTLEEVLLPHAKTHVRRLDIDTDGRIWYVNSGRGRLGRYDPASGEIKEWASPSGAGSHPYAIAIADGAVWYNESGTRPDMLVRFDMTAETFQSWAIPSAGITAGIIRHMRAAPGGGLILHQTATNRIIRMRQAQ